MERPEEIGSKVDMRTVSVLCQVELASAAAEIDQICQIPGIDGLWIGPTDLAQLLGHLGNPQHSDVEEVIDSIIEAANRHHKPWGIPTARVEDYEHYVKRGALIMSLGADTRLLKWGTSDLVTRARKFHQQNEHI